MPIKPVTGKIEAQEINNNLSYLESMFKNIDKNSPKGVYSSVTALQSAYPNGSNDVFIVSSDGKWYYWNGSSWVAGGTYQSTALADKSVTNDKLADGVFITKIDEISTQQTINLFNPKKAVKGVILTDGSLYTNTHVYTSDFIPVSANELFYKNTPTGFETSFWGVNKNFISRSSFSDYLITVPNNTNIAFMRVTVDPNSKPLNEYMVHRGNVAQPFVPFEYYEINNLKMNPDALDTAKNKDFVRDKMLPDFSIPTLKPYSLANNPVITKSKVTDVSNPWFTADPFIVYEKGVYHMFFEVAYSGVEEIGHAYSYNLKDWTYTQIVLPKAVVGHRSAYPHVFKHDGEYYMLPDTAYDVKLYKATNFPLEWELVSTLLTPATGALVDTNLFEYQGIWYMVTSDINNLKLYYNRSGDFRNNKWTFHSNLISQNASERGFRCAGNPFIGDDSVIIPVQITPTDIGLYGQYTYWYKLTDISTQSCKTTSLGLALPNQQNGKYNSRGIHHISHCVHQDKIIYAMDGRINDEYTIGIYESGEQVIAASMSPVSKVIPANTWTNVDVQINAGGFDTYYFIDRYANKKPAFDFEGLYLINVQIKQQDCKFRIKSGSEILFESVSNVGSKLLNVKAGSFYLEVYSPTEFTVEEINQTTFIDVIKLA